MHCFIFRTALPHTFQIRLPVSEYRGTDETGIPVRAGQMPGVVKNGADGCAAGAPQAAESESAFDIPDKRPGPLHPGRSVHFTEGVHQRSLVKPGDHVSGATFSSSTMARIEAFIEGHACVP